MTSGSVIVLIDCYCMLSTPSTTSNVNVHSESAAEEHLKLWMALLSKINACNENFQ